MNVAKDPVCGMTVLQAQSLKARHGEQTVYFCSTFCKASFEQEPAKYETRLVEAAREAVERTKIAYFSMEVALSNDMHTYSGGLGVLAGDTLKSAADLRVPMVGVTLLSRKGYFQQDLDEHEGLRESPAPWDPQRFLAPVSMTAEVLIEGRSVKVVGWEYQVVGASGFVVPVIFLDTNLDGNSDFDRSLTDRLYGGDDRYRLAQECVLGMGGVRMLRKLGYDGVERYHMNEGHASLLVLDLLRERRRTDETEWDFEGVRKQCVFTTHTPVAAGHDQFGHELAERTLGEPLPREIVHMLGGGESLNMTLLGFNLSGYINGCGQALRGSGAADVPGVPDRARDERCPFLDMDGRRVPRSLRSAYPRMEKRSRDASPRRRDLEGRDLGSTRRRESASRRRGPRGQRKSAVGREPHHRVRSPGDGL